MTKISLASLIVFTFASLSASGPASQANRGPLSPQTAHPGGRVIELGAGIRDVENFVLGPTDTLIVRQTAAVVAERAIVLRGRVIVALPEDAPQGARAPKLQLVASQTIVLLGEMSFGDGRPGRDQGVMGGTGASLYLQAPIIGIGVADLTMGAGAAGGPNVEGGSGGTFETLGWVIPFHDSGFKARGGAGGDGGDGLPGTVLHPRGHRGGDGGIGGAAAAWNPFNKPEFEAVSSQVLGIAPELDPFVGPDRRDRNEPTYLGGDGGRGGNGGPAFEGCETPAGGGRGGEGGRGGYAAGARGTPGAPPKFDANGQPYRFANSMHGQRGGTAIGGRGGNGGDAGEGKSLYIWRAGGRGGDGGDAVGGIGGAPPTVPDGTPANWIGAAGPGGAARGGGGGNGGSGNDGGDAGNANPGPDGTWQPPPTPGDEPGS